MEQAEILFYYKSVNSVVNSGLELASCSYFLHILPSREHFFFLLLVTSHRAYEYRRSWGT